MWNNTHIYFLQKIISGTQKLIQYPRLSTELSILLQANRRCLDFSDLVSLKEITINDLPTIHNACQFLFEEFAELRRPPDFNFRDFSAIRNKHDEFLKTTDRPGWEDFCETLEMTQKEVKHYSAVDCLFVTAMPLEFLAVVRRISFFLEGTAPYDTRGFIDNPRGKELLPGWIKGFISDDQRRSVSVAVVCCSRYGPIGASSAVSRILSIFQPKHIIVVGIAASLSSFESPELAIGDIGYSEFIDDISLGKDKADFSITSTVRLDEKPMWEKVPEEMTTVFNDDKPALRYDDNGSLEFTGLLYGENVERLKGACKTLRDKEQIELLASISQEKAEETDLVSTCKERRCPDELVCMARQVMYEGKWCDQIQLPNPNGPCKKPSVKQTRVLSGSRVVKQFGMREYLRDKFPGRLLLEMEGCGVAQICADNRHPCPIVVKSACDWATPPKNDVHHIYCADVSAAFAVELALKLSSLSG